MNIIEIQSTGAKRQAVEKMSQDKKIMLVEVSRGILRKIRSSGVYANRSGHQVQYIAFFSQQGCFVGKVQSIKKNVPLKDIYSSSESQSRTFMYRLVQLRPHPIDFAGKLPRGRKRVAPYEKFMKAENTTELFRSRYER